jgi:DNA-binding NarL/FixJ family response regulator
MQRAPAHRFDPATAGAAPLIHIALVEDDLDFRDTLIESLQAAGDMLLTGIAGTRAEGMSLLDQPPPDVLLVDLGLPDGSGIDVIRSASREWSACDIMVCTTFGDEAHVMRSIEAGAAGYLLKDSEPQSMLNEIRSLNGGGSPISPLIARRILMQFRQDAMPVQAGSVAPPASTSSASDTSAAVAAVEFGADEALHPPALAGAGAEPQVSLSACEMQVLELITKGFSAEEIAGLMQVSRHTVLTFIRRIYTKLKVSSKAAISSFPPSASVRAR